MYAHGQIYDFGVWSDIGVRKEFFNKVTVSLEEGIRLDNNATNINTINSDMGIQYEIVKNFDVKLSYRYGLKQKTNGYFAKHRTCLDFKLEQKLNTFQFEYRNRTSLSKDTYINEVSDQYTSFENRNKLSILYNIRGVKTDPFIGLESFHSLAESNVYAIESMRYFLGIEHEFKYNIKLQLCYLLNTETGKTKERSSVFQISVSKKL